jgi:hypothetical protein
MAGVSQICYMNQRIDGYFTPLFIPDFARQYPGGKPASGKNPAVSCGRFYTDAGADFSAAAALTPWASRAGHRVTRIAGQA